MLISLLIFAGLCVAAAQYRLIIDAGSSGSRLRVYNTTREGLVAVQIASADESSFRTEPGISSFASQPEGAGVSLAGLLRAAEAYVPAELHSSTPLWVKATAGMRTLTQPQLDAIFAAVKRYLRDSQKCPFQLVSASVLGGEEEAVDAYLGINTVLGTASSRPNSVGVLDMGGASTQVAYRPASNILDGEFHFYVHEERQSVYARSFPRFGMDTALDRAIRAVVQAADDGVASVVFPCFNRGYSESVRIGGRDINVTGTGDNQACGEMTQRLLHTDYECMLPPCPFMGVHMPRITGREHFYAISNFFYVPNGLGLIGWDERRVVRPSEIAHATAEFCARPMSDVRAATDVSLTYLRKFCFGGHYVWRVLRAFGFDDNSTAITCLRRMQHHSADWTLGAVLYETQEMPLHREAAARALPAPCVPEGDASVLRLGPANDDDYGVSRKRGRLGDQAPGLFAGGAPSIVGIPGWSLWVGGLFLASLLGWFARLLPNTCCGLKWNQAASSLEHMPITPQAILSRAEAILPPPIFRAVSAPMIQPYLPMPITSRRHTRQATWAASSSRIEAES